MAKPSYRQSVQTVPMMDGLMSKVVDAIDRMNLAEIVDCKTESLNMGSGDFKTSAELTRIESLKWK